MTVGRGVNVGNCVGANTTGKAVGAGIDGNDEGLSVGSIVGIDDGKLVGLIVGIEDGLIDGGVEGQCVGLIVG